MKNTVRRATIAVLVLSSAIASASVVNTRPVSERYSTSCGSVTSSIVIRDLEEPRGCFGDPEPGKDITQTIDIYSRSAYGAVSFITCERHYPISFGASDEEMRGKLAREPLECRSSYSATIPDVGLGALDDQAVANIVREVRLPVNCDQRPADADAGTATDATVPITDGSTSSDGATLVDASPDAAIGIDSGPPSCKVTVPSVSTTGTQYWQVDLPRTNPPCATLTAVPGGNYKGQMDVFVSGVGATYALNTSGGWVIETWSAAGNGGSGKPITLPTNTDCELIGTLTSDAGAPVKIKVIMRVDTSANARSMTLVSTTYP